MLTRCCIVSFQFLYNIQHPTGIKTSNIQGLARFLPVNQGQRRRSRFHLARWRWKIGLHGHVPSIPRVSAAARQARSRPGGPMAAVTCAWFSPPPISLASCTASCRRWQMCLCCPRIRPPESCLLRADAGPRMPPRPATSVSASRSAAMPRLHAVPAASACSRSAHISARTSEGALHPGRLFLALWVPRVPREQGIGRCLQLSHQ